jgi:taurine dioxygenase
MSDYTCLTVLPEAHSCAAAVHGIDLAMPLSDGAQRDLLAAWTAHAVLYFPDQALDPTALERLSSYLGPFGHDPYVKPKQGYEHVIEVRREARETAPIFGSMWHSDWSFQATPPSATLLYGELVPPHGGDTVFADAERAFAALSPTMQNLLLPLNAVHSAAPAYGPKGLFARDDASRSMQIVVSPEAEQTQVHPLVRRHPLSGRATLYINHVYTLGIEGLCADESQALLEFLFKHMTRSEFVYRHHWRAQMLVMWDNRRLLHYADGGYQGHRRVMLRTTVAGEQPLAARASQALT